MSSRSSVPRIISICGSTLSEVVVEEVVVTSNAVQSGLRHLSAAARRVYCQCSQTLKSSSASVIQSLSSIRADHRLKQEQIVQMVERYHLPATEAIQVSTLLTLATTPYWVENTVIRQTLASLQAATSLNAARQAQRNLFQTFEVSHHKVFVQAVKTACANAALKAGFPTLQTMPSIPGTLRLVATDISGRALVTEIHADPGREPSIEAEVVGISDGSCHRILDVFDRALQEQGVRSAPPRRKSTGGVCELAAAKEFVRRKVKRSSTCVKPAFQKAKTAARRSQRLNRRNPQKQR